MAQIKRRHHYVWKKYLEPWSVGDQVWCLRKGSAEPFATNPINLAVERDFYALEPFQPGDVEFVKRYLSPIKDKRLVQLNMGWIRQFEVLFAAMQYVRTHEKSSDAVREKLDELLIEFEENAFAAHEQKSAKYLSAFIEGDISGYDDVDDVVGILHFLIQQYFRTKRMKESILNGLSKMEPLDKLQRTWPVLRNFFVTNVGHSLFLDRKKYKLIVVNAPSKHELITCDQPVFNTHGISKSHKEDVVKKFELFYPVSPLRAVMLTDNPATIALHGTTLSVDEVDCFNRAVGFSAYEQIFARSKTSLAGLAIA